MSSDKREAEATGDIGGGEAAEGKPTYLQDFFEPTENFFDDYFGGPEMLATVKYAASTPVMSGCSVSFEPSVTIGRNSGDAPEGQLNMGCEVSINGLCDFSQSLTFDSEGKIETEIGVSELFQGMELTGGATVKTVPGADGEDSCSLGAKFLRQDFYATGSLTKTLSGVLETTASIGALWGNLTAGVELNRSSAEPDDAELTVGLGFHHEDWIVGAKAQRTGEQGWSSATVAATQTIDEVISSVKYEVDLTAAEPPSLSVGTSFPHKLPFNLWESCTPRWSFMGNTLGEAAVSVLFGLQKGISLQFTGHWAPGTLARAQYPQIGFTLSAEPEAAEAADEVLKKGAKEE